MKTLKFHFIVLRECFLHPFETSYINRDTLEVIRTKRYK